MVTWKMDVRFDLEPWRTNDIFVLVKIKKIKIVWGETSIHLRVLTQKKKKKEGKKPIEGKKLWGKT